MSAQDLLSQDEIDALLHGADEKPEEDDADAGGIASYDITSQERIVRGRMPTLEMINERFARYTRISLFNLLRRTADVSSGGLQIMKFGEYVHTLYVPTSLNLVKFRPLRSTALFILDAKLVFKLVDNFFGGDGRHAKIEGREFTPTEIRIVQLMLEQVFVDLTEAWAPVLKLELEYISSEVNPAMANIVSPSEVVVVSTFHIELDGGGGELHITLPYSMIEPVRELLDAGVQSDVDEKDDRWGKSLEQDVQDVDVNLHVNIASKKITLGDVLKFKTGDVIPIEMPEYVTVRANNVPTFRGKLGSSNGKYSVQMKESIKAQMKESLKNSR
ncbi:flagellar motor switch protein FliM [Marinomonas mediterranea]|jgi:flagellar motor switch protein FliM|uniref:Flagellar motor switch protein FliM n=1 Tax=Marinomonas mediterranea (strain ATCC 700492 / JCM 21426 / NBRC 103028 / MMB-1) TaxID=717774 RepID=F2K3K3_MARM1|nr:flagellar motor switch protein FliM [Marinomonas mediterranea]ADZ92442.1 flagellar motor switch protein FliM [Marinomonas mediterranea MMB-1]WCN10394.1 flagellar motor switch protein FliM [Marinomonas mediterranea]WCN14440.1 flagellar motor switch protein FliM [Marinomonas mediterranea]WCN18492.1 flagellar motor switch protein FliM [Marinomonas mediterranea MMB-1]